MVPIVYLIFDDHTALANLGHNTIPPESQIHYSVTRLELPPINLREVSDDASQTTGEEETSFMHVEELATRSHESNRYGLDSQPLEEANRPLLDLLAKLVVE
ncbi:hypothetical protein MPER_16100 [Moniliophthora perniciosa FA553]|nr:hypothetical protein MPER_16100 [Moniliophthora perniciosa FA553]